MGRLNRGLAGLTRGVIHDTWRNTGLAVEGVARNEKADEGEVLAGGFTHALNNPGANDAGALLEFES
jgi:hypothetical protein